MPTYDIEHEGRTIEVESDRKLTPADVEAVVVTRKIAGKVVKTPWEGFKALLGGYASHSVAPMEEVSQPAEPLRDLKEYEASNNLPSQMLATAGNVGLGVGKLLSAPANLPLAGLGAVGAAGKLVPEAASVASKALVGGQVGVGGVMVPGAVEARKRASDVLADPETSEIDRSQAVSDAVMGAGMVALPLLGAAHALPGALSKKTAGKVEGWADKVLAERGPGSGAVNTLDPEIVGAQATKALMEKGDQPVFFSRITRAVEQSPQQKATGEQWQGTIRNSKLGQNADEMSLVGVQDLDPKKSYTKAEVLDYLRANEVVVKDVTLGAKEFTEAETQRRRKALDREVQRVFPDRHKYGEYPYHADHIREGRISSDALRDYLNAGGDKRIAREAHEAWKPDSPTHFSTYQLPGAKEGSYREVLLTVPEGPSPMEAKKARMDHLEKKLRTGMTEQEYTERNRLLEGHPYEGAISPSWRDGHSQYAEHANPIVRMRYNERTTADGKRLLFLEELQAPLKGNFEKMPALFQKNWREIGFKWALRKAAEGDYDAIGWTTGEQQAARYDLSKQVDAVKVNVRTNGNFNIEVRRPGNRGFAGVASDVPASQLESHIGKDLAAKVAAESADRSELTYTGLDLKVGGEGLKRLYDSDFRNVVNGLPVVKKSGQKVGTAEIAVGDSIRNRRELETALFNAQQRDAVLRERGLPGDADRRAIERMKVELATLNDTQKETVHTLFLTPAMKAAARAGQALGVAAVAGKALQERDLEEKP